MLRKAFRIMSVFNCYEQNFRNNRDGNIFLFGAKIMLLLRSSCNISRETVFHRDIQTPRREWKIQHDAQRRNFLRNSRCFVSR